MADIKKFAVDEAIAKVRAEAERDVRSFVENMASARDAILKEITEHVQQIDAIAKAGHVADLLREAKLAYITEFQTVPPNFNGGSFGYPRLYGLPCSIAPFGGGGGGEVRLSEQYYDQKDLLPAGRYRAIVLIVEVSKGG